MPGYLVKAKRPAAVAARALTTPSTAPSVPTATDADELATWAGHVWEKHPHQRWQSTQPAPSASKLATGEAWGDFLACAGR